MFCQLFSLQNKSFLCLQHIENKGFQTVIKHRLKAIQKHIKNELGNREKKHKKCTFRFEKMHISFSRLYIIILNYTNKRIYIKTTKRVFWLMKNKMSQFMISFIIKSLIEINSRI